MDYPADVTVYADLPGAPGSKVDIVGPGFNEGFYDVQVTDWGNPWYYQGAREDVHHSNIYAT